MKHRLLTPLLANSPAFPACSGVYQVDRITAFRRDRVRKFGAAVFNNKKAAVNPEVDPLRLTSAATS